MVTLSMTDAMQETTLPLAGRVEEFRESEIRRMFDLAEAQDGELIRLEIGEPDFNTPEHIVEAAYEAGLDGATHYTHNAGIPALRNALADEMGAEHDLHADPADEICVTVGGMEAIYYALLAVADPGDEFVVPTPAWPNYFTIADLLDLNTVEVPLPAERQFDLDPRRVADTVSDDTAAVVLTSPSNPTGRVYDEETLAAVIETAADHDAYVVADEVYKQLVYEGSRRSIAALTDRENVVSVGSFSKTYAMTGWRVGWMVAPAPIVDAARKFQQGTTTCAPSISQHAALAALTGPQEPIRKLKRAFHERQEFVVDRLETLPLSCPTPQGGFYAFINVTELDGSSFDVARRLLEEYGVVTVPGSGFGDHGEGYLRVSFANDLDRLRLGFDRIEALVRTELEQDDGQS
jgi:aspartate aminotransferase